MDRRKKIKKSVKIKVRTFQKVFFKSINTSQLYFMLTFTQTSKN